MTLNHLTHQLAALPNFNTRWLIIVVVTLTGVVTVGGETTGTGTVVIADAADEAPIR